jgi:hypothetical protein
MLYYFEVLFYQGRLVDLETLVKLKSFVSF